MEWVLAALLVAVLAFSVAVWRRLSGAAHGEAALAEALERHRQATESTARDILERIGRIDADGRDAMTQRLTDFATAVSQGIGESRREIAERFDKLSQANAQQLAEIRREVEKRLEETVVKNQAHFGQVTARLGELYKVAGEMTGQMSAVAPDIRALAATLASPKGRGAFGEFSLSEILRDILPAEFYQEQYPLAGQERVDAAIFLKEGILPIDSKFSLPPGFDPAQGPDDPGAREALKAFRQAIQERAREIAEKYVVPGKTLDFALMYIPAESVYYRVILERDLHQALLRRKVIPVSPNSLYAYLQAIGIGLRGIKLEANARAMQKLILQLKTDFERFGRDFATLGTHLDNARKKYAETERDVSRFTERVAQLSLGEAGASLPPPAAREEGRVAPPVAREAEGA